MLQIRLRQRITAGATQVLLVTPEISKASVSQVYPIHIQAAGGHAAERTLPIR